MGDLQNLAAYLIQIAVVTAIAELLLRVIPVAAAGFRYAYWRLVLVAALVIPWVLRSTPQAVAPEAIEQPVAAAAAVGRIVNLPPAPVVTSGAALPAWPELLAWFVVAGVILRVAWVAVGMLRLRGLRKRGAPVADRLYQEIQETLGTRAELRSVAGLAHPVTFGLRRAVVLLPEDLPASAELRRAVVTHELVHVLRRDWVWVLAEEALRAVLWFHPAVWWLTSRIQLAREEFTDHLTVLATGSRRTYMEALLAFSDAGGLEPAPAFARRPHLFHRIVMLSKEAAMSSRRIVLSGAIMTALFIAGAWYASATFPVLKAPVLQAAFTPQDFQLPEVPRVPRPVSPPARPRAHAAVQAPGQAAPPAANRPTPENPIPRRLYSLPIPYPIELAGTIFAASLEMEVVLNGAGSVASVRRTTPDGETQHNGRPISEIFGEAAARSIQQWQYDPPAQAPLQFYVMVAFRPGQDAAASQSDSSRTGGRAAFAGVPPPPPPPPLPGQPIRVGGQIKAPVQIWKVAPEYPPIAQSARVQGVVILEVLIDEQGRVAETRILRSIPLLDQAAIDAVRQWQYEPTRLNGVPVPVIMTTTVQFTLDQ